jgi:hypothetical protein
VGVGACGEVVEALGESGDCTDQQVHAFGYGAGDKHRGPQSQYRKDDPWAEAGDMGNLSVVPVVAGGTSKVLVERTGRRRTRSDFQDR